MTLRILTKHARFTPGPYQIDGLDKPNRSTGRCIWRNDGNDGANTGWARICSHVNNREDALLLAAAPALYDALQRLHDDIAEYQKINSIGGYENQTMRNAREALAAARGEA